ncbi:hypothetical protein MUK42_37481 [Musa troglodytarum]|uniref:Uncharacterized protein n=1 Tax=Musa troglodytarum TaxID=320322 RepID=A0A9E7JUP8_9LILI|nr:hypothetical protein MUK42_37481 [Musa troglodytarum]
MYIAKSRTINVHSPLMYRYLLGLLCGLDSFVTSRIPVFDRRVDFLKEFWEALPSTQLAALAYKNLQVLGSTSEYWWVN